MRNVHSGTWIMARNMKNVKNETHTVGPVIGQEN